MKPQTAKNDPVVFLPNLRANDELANYWMRQATLRIRREIAWTWHERGNDAPALSGELPPLIDRASESLDLSRHWTEKQHFFTENVAAGYLSEQLNASPPEIGEPVRGSFSWVVNELGLDDISTFTLALVLASAFDASLGAVIGACLNDPARIYPNLHLVQRLWDDPGDVLTLSDPMHSLFSFGLLRRSAVAQRQYPETLWEQPLTMPSMVARSLFSGHGVLPAGIISFDTEKEEGDELSEANRIIAYRLKSEAAARLRVVPLFGNTRSAFRRMALDLSRPGKRSLWEYCGDPGLLWNQDYLNMLATLCWLMDRDLFIPHELFDDPDRRRERNEGLPLISIPVTLLMVISERRQVRHIDPNLMLPIVDIPTLTYEQRLAAWREGFGESAGKYEKELVEMARRFRYEKETIRQICLELKALPENLTRDLTEDHFIAACRAELNFDIGELGARVRPRFAKERLILPNKQAIQFEEQLAAMQSLTKVHYEWGTATAWNEGGITVLFAGPPGTGKTMAAEVMAQRLKLPMYRVDLSQVVNKYIGETEKNLKRIFDAAEISDMVIFFDEADACFGKRTDVNDSRDRYANLEVSYLLERMERFKGLAILATNRKNDLDQAFLRRIRHVIDFPAPDEAQRADIWQQVIPASVAKNSQIDIGFLARQFPLSGGHIRSIVFNASLQSAHAPGSGQELFMKDILIAVKREYDKINRSLSPDQLGPYARDIAELD
ncbi:MAG TPA: ATP-binding protein [Pyrinomonadaceae bacterium]|jgi:hypothetical protein|nr:ATP-binding protein [Pyrinomonadaceae bacterium]